MPDAFTLASGRARPAALSERLADSAEHPLGEEEDHEHEEDAEDEEPALGQPQDDLRAAEERGQPSEIRQEQARGQEHGGANQAAPERADAADDDHQQHVEHEGDAQRGLGIDIAHPHDVAAAGGSGV